MSEKVLCEKSDLVAIADAVREATGSVENYNVSELSAATVEAISNANPILQDKTVSPTALDQTITPDSNYDGLSQVIVKGDIDLKAENITEGVTIFDVAGSNPYEKTATDTEVNTQADLISQIATALEGKAAGGSSGGAQIASGSISISKTTTASKTIATIGGLLFEPKFVLCINNSTTTTSGTTYFNIFGGHLQAGALTNTYYIKGSSRYVLGSANHFVITINADGFVISSGSAISTSTFITSGTYKYYAIG